MFLLFASVVVANYDVRLREVAEACSRCLKNNDEQALVMLQETVSSLKTENSDDEKRQILIELTEAAILANQARSDEPPTTIDIDARMYVNSELIFSPNLVDYWIRVLEQQGGDDDKFAALSFKSPVMQQKWAKNVYQLKLDDEAAMQLKFDRVSAIMRQGYWIEKEAAIASLSVWGVELWDHPDLFSTVHDIVSINRDVFMLQRKKDNIPINWNDASFTLADFIAAHELGEETFFKIYKDSDVAKIVNGVSGKIAFTSTVKNMEMTTAKQIVKYLSDRRSDEKKSLASILSRKVDEGSREDRKIQFLTLILQVKDFAMSPHATEHWLFSLKQIATEPNAPPQVAQLMKEFSDEDGIVRKLRELHTLTDFRSKLMRVEAIIAARYSVRREFSDILGSLIGDIAMWYSQLLVMSPRNSEITENLKHIRDVLFRLSWAILLQREWIGQPSFELKGSKKWEDQAADFIRRQKSSQAFGPMYYTAAERIAVSQVSLLVAVIEGLKQSMTCDEDCERLVERIVFKLND